MGDYVLRFIVSVFGSAALAGITIAISNGACHQHWSFWIAWLARWFLWVFGAVIVVVKGDGIDIGDFFDWW